ncbi:VQ domain-containing protein [Heracleum sosnowskyi]|uniref:VQ domain-containing protein n=1 Tax=Heracleum sosnowskyi TaxID=360622 RepID=A0AAD8HTD9_9APIA|nr:VQ domain-containing protein [Heracleum sosnowskyi]
MDSGNSGSMQSSGGEEDYDPRAADSCFNPIFNHLSPPPPTIYDPSTNLSNFYNPPLNNPFFTPQSQTLPFHPHNFKQNQAPQPRNETTGVVLSQSQTSTRQNDQDQTTQVARNPKKRSRASRRAPTTVLTTDTSNFRAMVQEFTGIPAPPFTQSSSFPRSRLDLFSTPSSIRSSINITQTPSSYHTLLLRPLPQKLQPPRSSFTFFDNNDTILSAQSPLLFPNSSELGFLKHQPRGMIQMQNPNQSSFLESSLSNSSLFGSGHDFSLGRPSQPNLKINALEEFGLSYGQVNNAQVPGLPDLISPENGNNFARNEKQNNHPATNFYDGKRTTDNVSNSATKGTSEGMMEPWICSSD